MWDILSGCETEEGVDGLMGWVRVGCVHVGVFHWGPLDVMRVGRNIYFCMWHFGTVLLMIMYRSPNGVFGCKYPSMISIFLLSGRPSLHTVSWSSVPSCYRSSGPMHASLFSKRNSKSRVDASPSFLFRLEMPHEYHTWMWRAIVRGQLMTF